jgi:transposase
MPEQPSLMTLAKPCREPYVKRYRPSGEREDTLPEETARGTRAAFPRGHLYMRMRERTITVRPHVQYLSLQTSRGREQTNLYRVEYAKCAGIEGTISQAVRACGLRRARYIGSMKTHRQHVLTAAAINFIRIGRWLAGDRPAQTRLSPFVALMKHATSAA